MSPIVGVVAIVENDRSNRRGLQRLLTAHGYEVEPYRSAEEFAAAIGTTRASCAVVDIHLGPGLSGLDLAKDLASRASGMPVLLVSASLDPSYARRARALGAAFLEKPFEDRKLLETVARITGTIR